MEGVVFISLYKSISFLNSFYKNFLLKIYI